MLYRCLLEVNGVKYVVLLHTLLSLHAVDRDYIQTASRGGGDGEVPSEILCRIYIYLGKSGHTYIPTEIRTVKHINQGIYLFIYLFFWGGGVLK